MVLDKEVVAVNIDPSWTFETFILKMMTLRFQYKEILASFSNIKEQNAFVKDLKKQVYSLPFSEIRCDIIWEEINRIEEWDYCEKDIESDDELIQLEWD